MKGGIGLRRKMIDGDCYLSFFYLLRLRRNLFKRLTPIQSLQIQIVGTFDSDR